VQTYTQQSGNQSSDVALREQFRFEFVPANGQTVEVAMCGQGDKLALCLLSYANRTG
jgi:hypothetical protein